MSDVMQRFWDKVQKTDNCWLWTAGLKNGYGGIRDTTTRKTLYAHRVIYEYSYGPILPGMCVCHRCDNPRCVRPDHLFLGTIGDNNRDMAAKGRIWTQQNPNSITGEHNPAAKLRLDQVTEIQERFAQGNITKAALAREYGVSRGLIWHIVTGRKWAYAIDQERSKHGGQA